MGKRIFICALVTALLAGCTAASKDEVQPPVAKMSFSEVEQRVHGLIADRGGASSNVELRARGSHYDFLATYTKDGNQMVACGSATETNADLKATIPSTVIATEAAQAMGVTDVQLVAKPHTSDKAPGTYLSFQVTAAPKYPHPLLGQIVCSNTWNIEVYDTEAGTKKITEFGLPMNK